MKLIDILVKELPARGGWPEDINFITQDGPKSADPRELNGFKNKPDRRSAGEKIYWTRHGENNGYGTIRITCSEISSDYDSAIITREQYEAAKWNGEGLPPVGTECEWYDASVMGGWTKVRVMYLSQWVIVIRSIEDNFGNGVDVSRDLVMDKKQEFRPIRTEAECQRDQFAKSLCDYLDDFSEWDSPVAKVHACVIYDAIVAHKITGVTLVPSVSQIMRITEKCSREDAEDIVALLTTGTITE